jgi:hypothetical protein
MEPSKVGRPPRAPRVRPGLTIPKDLQQQLRAVSEETGIPQCRIAEQGLRLRLAQLDNSTTHKAA